MAIALVQQKAGSADMINAASLDVVLDAPQSPGGVVASLIGWGTSFDESPPEPTDNGTGENWTQLCGHVVSAACSIWRRDAGSDGFTTVSHVNNSGATRAMGVVLAEFSGLATPSHGAESVVGNTAGAADSIVLPAITPVMFPALILVVACIRDTDANEITITGGFTEPGDPVDAGDSTWAMGYKIVTLPGSHVATFTADVAADQNRFVACGRAMLGVGAVPAGGPKIDGGEAAAYYYDR